MKISILAAAAVFSTIAFAEQTRADDTKVALCEYCRSSDFRGAAEVAALSEPPRLVEGTQNVFVIDIQTDEIRYYEVVRESIEICQSPNDAGASTMSFGPVIDPDEPGPEIPECFSNWVMSSTQLAPPPAQLAEIRGALDEVDKFLADIQDIEASDLDFGAIFPIDSATDLIGPDGTAPNYYEVSARRQTFMNAISNDMTDTWLERVYWEVQSVAGAAAGKYLGQFAQAIVVTVNFADGTQISVRLTALLKDENGNITGFEMEIEPGSALLDDGITPLPVSAGGFIDHFGNPFTANPSLISNLSDLFVRGGGRVRTGPSSGGCSGTIMCWVEDGEEVCQGSLPDPQLSGC